MLNLKIWHYTDFRNLEWIPPRCFSTKRRQFLGFLYQPARVVKEIASLSHFRIFFNDKWLHDQFRCKEIRSWDVVFRPELTFTRNSASSVFLFGSTTQNENAESVEVFSLLLTYKDFYQTEIHDTRLILETYDEYCKLVNETWCLSLTAIIWNT